MKVHERRAAHQTGSFPRVDFVAEQVDLPLDSSFEALHLLWNLLLEVTNVVVEELESLRLEAILYELRLVVEIVEVVGGWVELANRTVFALVLLQIQIETAFVGDLVIVLEVVIVLVRFQLHSHHLLVLRSVKEVAYLNERGVLHEARSQLEKLTLHVFVLRLKEDDNRVGGKALFSQKVLLGGDWLHVGALLEELFVVYIFDVFNGSFLGLLLHCRKDVLGLVESLDDLKNLRGFLGAADSGKRLVGGLLVFLGRLLKESEVFHDERGCLLLLRGKDALFLLRSLFLRLFFLETHQSVLEGKRTQN